MNISIAQTPSAGRIKRKPIQALAAFFLRKAADRTGIRWGDLSLFLAGDVESRDINKAHLGHDYDTDVISFNLDLVPGDPERLNHGEIVINVAYARRMGRRYGDTNRELALYLAHGCDHLSGEDDATPATRMRMRRRELRWLREAKVSGLSFLLTDGAPKACPSTRKHRAP